MIRVLSINGNTLTCLKWSQDLTVAEIRSAVLVNLKSSCESARATSQFDLAAQCPT